MASQVEMLHRVDVVRQKGFVKIKIAAFFYRLKILRDIGRSQMTKLVVDLEVVVVLVLALAVERPVELDRLVLVRPAQRRKHVDRVLGLVREPRWVAELLGIFCGPVVERLDGDVLRLDAFEHVALSLELARGFDTARARVFESHGDAFGRHDRDDFGLAAHVRRQVVLVAVDSVGFRLFCVQSNPH